MPGAHSATLWRRVSAFIAQPRLLAFAAAAFVLIGVAAIWWQSPPPPPPSLSAESGIIFAPCLFHRFTGWHCPGCGTTRGIAALLHGDWRAALGYNAFGLPVLATALLLLVRPWCTAVRHNRWQPPPLPRSTGWWLLGIAILYAVLRNLPWPPFNALAP